MNTVTVASSFNLPLKCCLSNIFNSFQMLFTIYFRLIKVCITTVALESIAFYPGFEQRTSTMGTKAPCFHIYSVSIKFSFYRFLFRNQRALLL